MSDDTRSTYAKNRRPRPRILVVNNPGPEEGSSSSEERMGAPNAYPTSYPAQLRPLPSPSRSMHQERPQASHIPPPLTTNLPEHRHCYPSSRSNPSNPALSSPSSTSSPAVESTPPPSTPGQSAPPIDLNGDAGIRQEAASLPTAERNDSTPHSTSRPGKFLGFKLPQSGHTRRHSNNRQPPQQSPTTTTPDTYTQPNHALRSPPNEKVIFLVTSDADKFATVDITGAITPAFIRERIFTKLQVSDEDQSQFSIYRTEIGSYAIGDALTDGQLFELYREQGDSKATVKLLVCHSSAPVHESPQDPVSVSPTVNTIPPPVLPEHTLFAPLQPVRRRSRSRRDSQSSASERLLPEVAAGYEASVSDDLEHGERETRRSTIRPPAQHSSPSSRRPGSPSSRQRPQSPVAASSERSLAQSPDAGPVRSEVYRGGVQMGTPPLTQSPQNGAFAPPPPSLRWDTSVSSTSDVVVEREKTSQTLETQTDYSEKHRRAYRDRDEKDKERERLKRKDRARAVNYDVTDSRQLDGWTVVSSDIPSSGYKRDRPTTPQETRSPRYPGASTGFGPLSIPSPPRGPLPNTPGGPSHSKKHQGKQVHPMWPVAWKGAQSPPSSKSMTDMRGAYRQQIPPSLQPGHPARPPQGVLPLVTRPSTGNTAACGTEPPHSGSSAGDALSPTYHEATHSDAALPRSYDGHRGVVSPVSRHPARAVVSPGISTGSSTITNHLDLTSPSQEPFPRPRSALDDPAGPSYPQRRSPRGADVAQDGMVGSSHVRLHSGPSSQAVFNRNDGDTVAPLRPNPRLRSDTQPEVPSAHLDLPAQPDRACRTPPHSPVRAAREPRSSAPAVHVESSSASSLSNDDDEDASETLFRHTEHAWLAGFIDETAAEDTARPREQRVRPQARSGQPSAAQAPANPAQAPPAQAPPIQSVPSNRPPPDQPPGSTSQPLSSQVPAASLPSMRQAPSSNSFPSIDALPNIDDDSDSDGGGTIWAKRPDKTAESSLASRQRNTTEQSRSIIRPPLPPLSIENSPSSAHQPLPNTGHADTSRLLPPNFPGPPDFLPPPLPQRTARRNFPTPSATKGAQEQRTSRFDDNYDYTWAPRPPPEDVYDRLEEYFPEHDLDKPVIETPSGGTSPTTAENPTPTLQRYRHKKSIRVVAAEHKRRIDRTSRMESSSVNAVLRKRNTKLWGSKLEEVQARSAVSTSSQDASPGGALRPIFRWVRGELIGKGTYGKVYLALNATTGDMIAVKQVEIPRTASDKDDSRQVTVVEALKLESETLKDLDHPHIVQYLGFEETPTFLSIFLEYVPGGSIASCLRKYGKFDEEVTKSFTGQILSGLEYLHSKGILHRDLKADNILVETSGICKISDFGISKRTDDINIAGAYTSMQGTVFWMAPEVIDPQRKGYNAKIDIWSVGCVIFEMWTGQRPWSGQEAMAVLLHLYQTQQGPPLPPSFTLSPLADDFRQQCFATNPDDRPTATALRLHHYLDLQPGWQFNGFK